MADVSAESSEGMSAIGDEQPTSAQPRTAADNASMPKAKALVCRCSDIVVCKSHPTATMRRTVLLQLKALSSEQIKARTVDGNDAAGL